MYCILQGHMELRRQGKVKNKANFRFSLEKKNNDNLLNERQLRTPPTSQSSKQLIWHFKMLNMHCGLFLQKVILTIPIVCKNE